VINLLRFHHEVTMIEKLAMKGRLVELSAFSAESVGRFSD
jgi:hypothetical protein